MDEPGYRLGYVQAMFTDAPPASLIIEEKENGSFVVDWESYVRYGELQWRDFLKMQPSQPKLFRVIASKAEKTGTAATDSRLEMIELKHPEEEGTVFATIDEGDPELAPVVQQLFSRGNGRRRTTHPPPLLSWRVRQRQGSPHRGRGGQGLADTSTHKELGK